MEQWKDIKGYENLYQISNLGRVKSCERYRKGKNNSIVRVNEKILKYGNNGNGYLQVNLYKEEKVKNCLVHRLVADAFIDNPNNLPQVNHINENKTDNRVDNLEWCSREYNNQYSKNIPVYSINKTTNEITYYQSTSDAERITGICQSNISKCCKGKLKSAGGRYWYYAG